MLQSLFPGFVRASRIEYFIGYHVILLGLKALFLQFVLRNILFSLLASRAFKKAVADRSISVYVFSPLMFYFIVISFLAFGATIILFIGVLSASVPEQLRHEPNRHLLYPVSYVHSYLREFTGLASAALRD